MEDEMKTLRETVKSLIEKLSKTTARSAEHEENLAATAVTNKSLRSHFENQNKCITQSKKDIIKINTTLSDGLTELLRIAQTSKKKQKRVS